MQEELLYGADCDKEAIRSRFCCLADKFFKAKGTEPDYFFSSPGRAEVLGNHTDHNLGKVIVSAISCDIIAAVQKRGDGLIEICSDGFYPIHFNVRDTKQRHEEKGRSYALARGVIEGIKRRGFTVGGFTAYTASNVFRGAGVSSSAAFEVLIAEIINSLYLGGALTPSDKAAVGQFAENVYFGKPCGLLDQTGVALGGMNKIDFITPSAPKAERLSPPAGYSIVITNAGGSHAALTEHYADIKKEMLSVAKLFGKEHLRSVEKDEFAAALPALRAKTGERAILRAMHFFEENERVELAAEALKAGETQKFLRAVNDSGESSIKYLQNAFVPGSGVQPIPLAIKLSQDFLKESGAVRLHGGGFAGTVIAFVPMAERADYIDYMSRMFGAENVFSAHVRNIGASQIDL